MRFTDILKDKSINIVESRGYFILNNKSINILFIVTTQKCKK